MVAITISEGLKSRVPGLALGCVTAEVRSVAKHDEGLWHEIDTHLARLAATHKADDIAALPQVAAMRAAYKALGKEPSRYRGSAEALLRRVLSGKALYRINSVVDINNLVSLESFQPLGSYDLTLLGPAIELRIGAPGETYKGIGKEMINIESLPVFADATGAFGSPTSDSERAMIRPESRRILMAIFSFIGPDGMERWMGRAVDLLRNHCNADGIQTKVVS
jgi:DNA/RNA-binding domain of Phe-tRNA-synthetase-like protein